MGFKSTPERILFLKRTNQSVEITAEKNDDKHPNSESTTLDTFFGLLERNSLDKIDLKLVQVSTLDLSHCQLTDLPLSLQCINLIHLNLSHNRLTTVPTCIYNGMATLEYLNLNHNLIKTFDMQPACLTRVKNVKINNNLLLSLPRWILYFQSTNLEELNFSCNQAKSYNYPKNSYNMNVMKLKKLKLKNSQLLDVDFNFLKCLQSLEYLDISNKGSKSINKLYEIDNLFVKLKWKRLATLKVNNLSISLFPDGIAWIETLTELRISQNYISWLPDSIEFLVNLQILDISDNTIIAIPKKLATLEWLEILLASNNLIETCPDFNNMMSLKTLDLYDNLLDSVPLYCDTVKEVDLECNYFHTDNFINYQTKKDTLRQNFDVTQSRGILPKTKPEYVEDSSSESDEDGDNSFFDKTIVSKTVIDETEDWDSLAPLVKSDPQIDSDDEEWNGEENMPINRSKKVRMKIYVEDEDWMFEDIEEETPQ